MAEKTLIIHGWSDVSASFEKIKLFLQEKLKYPAADILFVDYESQEDNLTFNDVADGLNDRLISLNLIDAEGNAVNGDTFNIIVHSTGGLVIRHWIASYYADCLEQCPVKRIIMLAPANFGSPLAKPGKSFLGAIATGRKNVTDMANFLETGQQILDGLELGSAFQWHLAHKDLLSPVNFYSGTTIQTTVLVGIEDYKDFLRSFVNKPGTDGTVVISGTQLDTVKFSLNFNHAKYSWSSEQSISSTAFGVMPEVNHSKIVEAASRSGTMVSEAMLKALKCNSPAKFQDLQVELAAATEQTFLKADKPKYEQFVVHAVDDFGESISDFTLEFFVTRAGNLQQPKAGTGLQPFLSQLVGDNTEVKYSKQLTEIICKEFETFSKDRSFRRFLVDVELLRAALREAAAEFGETAMLCLKIWVPKVSQGIEFDIESLKALAIYDSETASKKIAEYEAGTVNGEETMPALFYPNTTTLIELQVNRFNNLVWVGTKAMTKKGRAEKVIEKVSRKYE